MSSSKSTTLLNKLRRRLPKKDEILRYRLIRPFAHTLQHGYLWHWHRRNVSNAMLVGLLCAFTPWPLQMLQAVPFAILFRAHLPTSILLVWITNPLTMPVIFYFAYSVGVWLLGIPPIEIAFSISLDWWLQFWQHVWAPFLLGCLVCGVLFGLLLKYAIYWLWTLHLIRRFQQRFTRK